MNNENQIKAKDIFDSKEHYLKFRKAWANAHNSERAKKRIVHETFVMTSHRGKEEYEISYLKKGWLTAAHMIFYNAMREKPLDSGFTNLTNPTVLLNGGFPNQGYYLAFVELGRIAVAAKRLLKDEEPSEWTMKIVSNFIEPFCGTITPEMLIKAWDRTEKHRPVALSANEALEEIRLERERAEKEQELAECA